jgi:hypothetical protein
MAAVSFLRDPHSAATFLEGVTNPADLRVPRVELLLGREILREQAVMIQLGGGVSGEGGSIDGGMAWRLQQFCQ